MALDVPYAYRRGAYAFPLEGRYRHDSVLLSQSGLSLTFSFGEVPMRRFELRMQLGQGLRARPGASLYAEVSCPEVPVYGPALIAIGLCNRGLKLPVSGTFITRRYDRGGRANRRPRGARMGRVELRRPTATEPGSIVARLELARGARYQAAGLLLADAASGDVIPLDYRKALSQDVDHRGDIREVRLRIPPGTSMPDRLRVHVIADVFPLATRELEAR